MSFILGVVVLLAGALIFGAFWSDEVKSTLARANEAALALLGKGHESPPAAEAEHVHAPGEAPRQYYTCGMHPWVILPNPGDCPICHMKLVPLDPAKYTTEVVINPVMTQSIGVRIAPVVVGPVTRVIRTVGSVDYNETMVRDVTLKVGGWIEKLHVNYVGQPVKKDEPLLDIYSPDLYTAQEEYLLVFKRKADAAAPPELAGMDQALRDSARKRLENYDLSADQIRRMEESGKAERTVALRSPFQGLVVMRNVYEGMRVDAGAPLLRIADLSKVWIMVALYEYQIPFVQVGQQAVMRLPYVPGVTFEGKVTYIYPFLNQESRQVRVRLEFDNPNLVLKPGMYASVELRSTLASERVLVPREAVIDTGVRQVAYVSLGEGRFEPREVRVGVEAEGGMIEILDGLKPGEMVVTSGEFLLDSEARLREALAKLVKGDLAADQKAASVVEGTSELASLPDPAAKAIEGVLDGYFRIASLLADDTLTGAAEPARLAAENTAALIKTEIPGQPQFWAKHTEAAQVRGKALELVAITDLARAREAFADMSVALGKLLRATGVPPSYGKKVEELHCPMYREGQGGTIWLQPGGDVRNPYYGKGMIGCFDRRTSLPVTGAKPKM
jgi:RND family efflux transporter MFP subunit